MLYFIAVISRYNHCWESAAISSHSRCCSHSHCYSRRNLMHYRHRSHISIKGRWARCSYCCRSHSHCCSRSHFRQIEVKELWARWCCCHIRNLHIHYIRHILLYCKCFIGGLFMSDLAATNCGGCNGCGDCGCGRACLCYLFFCEYCNIFKIIISLTLCCYLTHKWLQSSLLYKKIVCASVHTNRADNVLGLDIRMEIVMKISELSHHLTLMISL